ncbi:MAG: hypothetical protein ACK4ZM_04650 [bacterium]
MKYKISMDDKVFIQKLKEVVDFFANENFDAAIQKAKKLKENIQNQDDIILIENIIKIISSAQLINQQKLEEALSLLESSYNTLKNYRPNYKGLKIENLLQSVNQSIIDIKSLIKK